MTLDPIAAMAEGDKDVIEALLAQVQFSSQSIGPLLEKIAAEAGWQAVRQRHFRFVGQVVHFIALYSLAFALYPLASKTSFTNSIYYNFSLRALTKYKSPFTNIR